VSDRIRCFLGEYLRENDRDFSEEIRDDMSFDYIGLDSLARVGLLTALDKEFGVSLDPTAAYDFVTVGALSEYVWSQISGNPMDVKKVLGI
jgi:acyl carrier protein